MTMDSSCSESTEAASNVGMGEAAEPSGTVSPRKVGRARRRMVSGWRSARHLLEMVVAMLSGMAVLGAALAMLGEPPGYANLLVQYGVLGAFMAAPMLAWMRYRGHSWRDGGEMTAAMVVPMLALAGLAEGFRMLLSHLVMIGGMVALMAYRFERHAHDHRA